MSDISAAPRTKLRRLLDTWAEALTGEHRHRAVLLSLAAYGAIWTLYRIIARMPLDIHFDMSEAYAWSRTIEFGYDKHPPLTGWIVAAWFALVPISDWTFTLLATLNLCVALYISWRMLDRWTEPAKAAFGLALLTLHLFYNFHSLKYNANTVLLPFWAFTAYAVLRAVEARTWAWGALAGAGAGLAMLGKYWSIFLVAGLGLATLLDCRRKAFLKSPAPWLMILVGVIVLAPHLAWLETHDFASFAYAEKRSQAGLGAALWNVLRYLRDIAAYCALPIAVWAWCVRPNAEALSDVVNPSDPQHRLVLLCFALPNILPAILALIAGFGITGLWTLPGYALLPLVLLGSPRLAVGPAALHIVLSASALLSLGALVLSPGVSLWLHLQTTPRASDNASLLATEVADRWQASVGKPLPLISGDPDLAMAVAYELRLPSVVLLEDNAPAIEAVLRSGAAVVCEAKDQDCVARASRIAASRAGSQSFCGNYQRALFGIPGRAVGYSAFLVPPPT